MSTDSFRGTATTFALLLTLKNHSVFSLIKMKRHFSNTPLIPFEPFTTALGPLIGCGSVHMFRCGHECIYFEGGHFEYFSEL